MFVYTLHTRHACFLLIFCFVFILCVCGLFSAKFLKAEQVDHDSVYTSETAGSVDGTGRVGTYFYTAPEIEQGWPHIDEKVYFIYINLQVI